MRSRNILSTRPIVHSSPRAGATWTTIAVALACVACGPSMPPQPPEVTALAGAEPSPGEPAPRSACDGKAACAAACQAGGADAANACTGHAEYLYPTAPDEARALWLEACKRRDGVACLRLMALVADSAETADGYANHACAYGAAQGCEMLGTRRLLLARERGGERARLEAAATAYHRACMLGRWTGCLWEAITLAEEAMKSPDDQVAEARRRAFEQADGACKANDVLACEFRAELFQRSGDAAAAGAAHAMACLALLRSGADTDYESLMQNEPCKRAAERGVAPPAAAVTQINEGRRALPGDALQRKRIGGPGVVPPTEKAKLELARRRIHELHAVAQLCLAPSGLVDSITFEKTSGLAGYDRQLFDTMRTWRYHPFEANGAPFEACGKVTFIYRQGR